MVGSFAKAKGDALIVVMVFIAPFGLWYGSPSVAGWDKWVSLLLPVVSGFVGILLGSFLTRRARRREWIAENQKNEYKELLAAITDVHLIVIKTFTANAPLNDLEQAISKLTRVVNSCLFITSFLEETKVPDDFRLGVQQLYATRDLHRFQDEHWKRVNKIVDTARAIKL